MNLQQQNQFLQYDDQTKVKSSMKLIVQGKENTMITEVHNGLIVTDQQRKLNIFLSLNLQKLNRKPSTRMEFY